MKRRIILCENEIRDDDCCDSHHPMAQRHERRNCVVARCETALEQYRSSSVTTTATATTQRWTNISEHRTQQLPFSKQHQLMRHLQWRRIAKERVNATLRFSKQRRQKTLVVRVFVTLIAIILSSSSPPVVYGSWIDPDTPMDQRTTRPINVKVPMVPVPDDHDKTAAPTNASSTCHPTSAPTSTPKTQSPTHAPTSYPTTSPTFNPDKIFELVFSDEFNTPNREFYDGADPRWTALNKNDYTNDALHYYSPANARTNQHGELVITTRAEDTDVVGFDDVKRQRTRVTKHFSSAMLQTWNKFCLTGGILEARVTLPGKSNVGGLWPAFWLLGNLARHTYVGSSEHIWPWAATHCPVNATTERAQRVSGCDAASHYGMHAYVGRGSPEIDIFEVQPGDITANHGPFLKSPVGQPFMSTSYQVAPGRTANRPGAGEWPGPGQWYKGLQGGINASLNILFYGTYNHFRDDVNAALQDYWSDAISYNRQLDESHFTGPHTYRLEWDVPKNNNESYGYLHWFLDGELVYSIDGKGLKETGNGAAEISSEPSYIILNTAISKQWGFPHECPGNCPCKKYDCNSKRWQDWCGFSPGFCKMMQSEPEYKIDWIRAYQDPNDASHKVGCSTPERPTRKFIVAHEGVYKTETDEHPLKGIPVGLGSCDPHVVPAAGDDDATDTPPPDGGSGTSDGSSSHGGQGSTGPEACGGLHRGRCTSGRVCECREGWTGPHCLANVAYDDIVYDAIDKITDVGFVPPQVIPWTLVGTLTLMGAILLLAMKCKRRLAIWQPIPDVAMDYLIAAKRMHHHRRGLSV